MSTRVHKVKWFSLWAKTVFFMKPISIKNLSWAWLSFHKLCMCVRKIFVIPDITYHITTHSFKRSCPLPPPPPHLHTTHTHTHTHTSLHPTPPPPQPFGNDTRETFSRLSLIKIPRTTPHVLDTLLQLMVLQ